MIMYVGYTEMIEVIDIEMKSIRLYVFITMYLR